MAGETPLGPLPWPYPVEYDKTDYQDADVLVIGGGASGCFAAMGAASRGARVVMWEKAATMTSGAMGSGCDHWEMAATNPCSPAASTVRAVPAAAANPAERPRQAKTDRRPFPPNAPG